MNGFVKAIIGIVLIFGLGILGTFLLQSATGGYIGAGLGLFISLLLFVIKSDKKAEEKAEEKSGDEQ